METTRTRPPKVTPSSSSEVVASEEQHPGEVRCASCHQSVPALDTYTTEQGDICGLCYADEDIRDSINWGTKVRIRSLIGVPGYMALALMVLWPLLSFLVGNPAPYFAPVVAFVSLIGWRAVYDAVRLDDVQTSDRVKLGLMGGLVGVVLLALAVVFVLPG